MNGDNPWQGLADALNALESAGNDLHFGDLGDASSGRYRYTPFVWAINKAHGTRVRWDYRLRLWLVEH
ncbi:hypothetical protein [Streptomyces specialis]|uniref:hypothetical protein n=1 Tax=Streptomyces specialis TaxID=498367 RepID=UPI00073F0B39|nr:hypothetical protein [Streptomyces specialis]